jgi:hypothetical protein
MVPYLLLVFTIFEVLEGPIHGGNELETSNCNERHNEPCKTSFSTEICAGAIISVVQYLSPLRCWLCTLPLCTLPFIGALENLYVFLLLVHAYLFFETSVSK